MGPSRALTQIVLTLNCNISVERSLQSSPHDGHPGHLASQEIFLPCQLGWDRETQTRQHQPLLPLHAGLGGEKKEQQSEVKLVRILFLIQNNSPLSPPSALSLLQTTNIKTKTLRWAQTDVMSYNWPTSDGLDCISVRWGFLKTVWRSGYTSIPHIGHGYMRDNEQFISLLT